MGMDVEEFAIRTHHWHLIVPVVIRSGRTAIRRALSQARGSLGTEQRHRAASRNCRPAGAGVKAFCRGPGTRCARGPGSPPRDCAVRGSMSSTRTGLGAVPGSSWPGATPWAQRVRRTCSRIACSCPARVGTQSRGSGRSSHVASFSPWRRSPTPFHSETTRSTKLWVPSRCRCMCRVVERRLADDWGVGWTHPASVWPVGRGPGMQV